MAYLSLWSHTQICMTEWALMHTHAQKQISHTGVFSSLNILIYHQPCFGFTVSAYDKLKMPNENETCTKQRSKLCRICLRTACENKNSDKIYGYGNCFFFQFNCFEILFRLLLLLLPLLWIFYRIGVCLCACDVTDWVLIVFVIAVCALRFYFVGTATAVLLCKITTTCA